MINAYKQRSRSSRKLKQTAYEHRGFGFDGAPGHDVVIMEKLRNRVHNALEQHLQPDLLFFGVANLTQRAGSVTNYMQKK